MTTPAARPTTAADALPASPEARTRWLTDQRWFDRTGSGEVTLLPPVPIPTLPAAGVQVAQTADGHRYQLLVPSEASAAAAHTAADQATDPAVAAALVAMATQNGSSSSPLGTLTGHWLDREPPPGTTDARPLGADQSNTSVVVGGSHVLKILRRLEAGTHPEVEVGRHFHAVAHRSPDLPALPVAPLSGWYELTRPDGTTTTLGVINHLVPGALDGWALTLSALAADPGGLLRRLRQLGVAVAHLHDALAEPAADATAGADAFGRAALTPAEVHEVVRGTVRDLPGLHPAVSEPAAVRIRERIEALAAQLDPTDLGAAIRSHGDLHLGQTVVGAHGWVVLDFEGEPARPLAERRRHQSPLRDVAGLLRSLSYAAETVRRSGATAVPDGWEPAARAAVLDGYLATVDPGLLPATAATTRRLLTLFEVEKAVYEVGYELAHRPDWVVLPLSALERSR